jgi:RHS repeat-associated protein
MYKSPHTTKACSHFLDVTYLSSLENQKRMKFSPPIPSCSTENFCFHMGDYSFGFNGKELDKEGMGGGASTYDYGFRIYNSALGRFLSVDPLMSCSYFESPYHYASSNPILYIDFQGLVKIKRNISTTNSDGKTVKLKVKFDTDYPQTLEVKKRGGRWVTLNFSSENHSSIPLVRSDHASQSYQRKGAEWRASAKDLKPIVDPMREIGGCAPLAVLNSFIEASPDLELVVIGNHKVGQAIETTPGTRQFYNSVMSFKNADNNFFFDRANSLDELKKEDCMNEATIEEMDSFSQSRADFIKKEFFSSGINVNAVSAYRLTDEYPKSTNNEDGTTLFNGVNISQPGEDKMGITLIIRLNVKEKNDGTKAKF